MRRWHPVQLDLQQWEEQDQRVQVRRDWGLGGHHHSSRGQGGDHGARCLCSSTSDIPTSRMWGGPKRRQASRGHSYHCPTFTSTFTLAFSKGRHWAYPESRTMSCQWSTPQRKWNYTSSCTFANSSISRYTRGTHIHQVLDSCFFWDRAKSVWPKKRTS